MHHARVRNPSDILLEKRMEAFECGLRSWICNHWFAVKELQSNYHNPETHSFIAYPVYGYLNLI